MIEAAIGVDAGGTYAKIAAVTPAGRILRQERLPTRPELGPGSFVRRISELVAAWRRADGMRLLGLGLGIAGEVDSEKGRLRFAPNLKGWDGYGFKAALTRSLRLRVSVENDANAAVWGGYVAELKRRPRSVVGVTLGTGVGGGLVVEGRLYRGFTGSAGEIGHMVVEPGGELCHCGSRGCLEAYAGSYGIVRAARRVLSESARASRLRGGKSIDPERIAQAADRGDWAAREVWSRTGRRLAVGLSNLVLLLNPEAVLLLGGVSRAGHWLLDPIRAHLRRQPFAVPFGRVRLIAADNPDGGCLGAALLALEDGARRR